MIGTRTCGAAKSGASTRPSLTAVRAPMAAAYLLLAGAGLSAPLAAGAQELPELTPAELSALTPLYLAPGESSGLPLVQPNRNERRAGDMGDGVYRVSLEVQRSDWRLETPTGPGLRVAAVAESGQLPTIPAPMIRATVGTRIAVTIANRLDTPVDVLGLHDRDGRDEEGVHLTPGEVRTVEWMATTPGTFFYDVREVLRESERLPEGPRTEREQAAGALVIDAPGDPEGDRIMVINIFSQPIFHDGEPAAFLEGLAINGQSWPFTERIQMEVGQAERWRVINASRRNHPMHLHGFYFDVLARGDQLADTVYAPDDQRLVVTEFMFGRTTMLMEWVPSRPGSWLFHCHLSFHVAPWLRLPGAEESDPHRAHDHMAGLIMGIEVAPGPTDLIARGPVRSVHLRTVDVPGDEVHEFGFIRVDGDAPDTRQVPGPLLVFNQYESADVTVENTMSQPTGIHWHGLELDAWADGVPDWSASDGRVSPVIETGEAFTYRLSFMRPGTFMYHTHMNDIVQLTGGLYGPLVVLPEGETFDPATDHLKVVSWNTPNPTGGGDIDVNGAQGEPDARAVVGEAHRVRLVNIAPAGRMTAWVMRAGERVEVQLIAKDGADLPVSQQIMTDRPPGIGVGETFDVIWTPLEPGEYVLHVGPPNERFSHTQRFVVTGPAES